MPKVMIFKELLFSSAHALPNDGGKCSNLHGHNYRIKIWCMAEGDDSKIKAIDSCDIQTKIGGWVDENLDCGCLVASHDSRLLQYCTSGNEKYFVLAGDTTVENLSAEFLTKFQAFLNPYEVKVTKVEVWETSDHGAVAIAD